MAKQPHGLFVIEQGILNTGKTGAQAALDDDGMVALSTSRIGMT
jgi:hypothetical protein